MNHRRRVVACVLPVVLVAACGGGGGDDPEGAAEVLATQLLGAEPTDDTRDDHECISAAIADSFDDDALVVLAEAVDLDDLDLPSRERLLQAALRCVPAVELGG